MTDRLKDKIAVITGAGQGIGKSIATVFVAEGATVIIAEKSVETGQAVAAALGCDFACTDVTLQADVEACIAEVLSKHGRIDILVNNAGANVFYKPHEMPRSEWARCMALDLESSWSMCEAVLPDMRKRGAGAIVNIASCHSFKIIPHTFPYPVAKHGLVGLTRALGVEYAPEGIRVNAIAPGYVDTELARDYWAGFDDPKAARAESENLHPARRIGRPDEVAMTAVFLASDEAPFINAETIVIDGGRSALYHD